MPLEICGLQREGLSDPLADLEYDIAGHFEATFPPEQRFVFSQKNKLLLLLRFQFATQAALQLFHLSFAFAARARQLLEISGFEILPQFFKVKADIVGRPVLGQDQPIAIENLSSYRRDAHGAKRLHLEVRLEIARRDDLHPPKTSRQ